MNDLALPTDHAALSVKLCDSHVPLDEILLRAFDLGTSDICQPHQTKRPVPMYIIDTSAFADNLPEPDGLWHVIDDVDKLCSEISNALYTTASVSKKAPTQSDAPVAQDANERWEYLLRHGDSKQIWRAIGWDGSFQNNHGAMQQPSDAEFCKHYEKLLNPEGMGVVDYEPRYHKYIPVLDDAILPGEVPDCVKSLKLNKSAGCDGVPPGVLKLLTDDWLCLLTVTFNLVFNNAYPSEWLVSKMFNIFKKGDRLSPDNYRGISVLMCLPKLYDAILSQRLRSWYSPLYEQAGAQPKRGCEEQILTLRLLIEIARKCRNTLSIAFIDYAKAYDNVVRQKMLKFLDDKGCGTKFLQALKASYNGTLGQIGGDCFEICAGV